jgi:UDP-N-acetylmuramyl pentapeptide synthase
VWPARLSFVVHWGRESHEVRTKLVGEHWLASALATIAAALHYGIGLASAASALAQVEPLPGRMEPVPLPCGATVLRDDFSTSSASLPAALRVLEQAPGRRLLVFNDAYDTGLNFRERFQQLGPMAARSVDLAVFIGERGRNAARRAVEGGLNPEAARSFPSLWEAAEYLKSELREGDLVLLRDRYRIHAERLYFALLGSVGCRMPACSLNQLCDYCSYLRPGLEETTRMPPPVRPYWEPR